MADAAPTLMTKLKEATWPQHQHAESRPLEQALVKGQLTKEGYVALLEQRLHVHEALDAAWVEAGKKDERLNPLVQDELLQVENIKADLNHFGSNIAEINVLPSTKAIIADIDKTLQEEPLSLLGAYYVFEGSKNGGHMLAKGLRHMYGLSGQDGTRYFDPHGDQQRPMWAAWKGAVDEITFNDDEQAKIIALAQRAFDHVSAIDDELYETVVATNA